MKKLDKYILSELQLPVIFGISLFTFIFLIDLLTQLAEMLVVKSVPMVEVITLLSYNMPKLLVETIPMGVFLGVMITYNSLSSTSEIVAMQSTGIGINRLLRTPMLFGMCIMIFVYLFQETVVPTAYRKSKLLLTKIVYTRPSAQLEEKKFEKFGNYEIYVNEFDKETNQPKNLVVFLKESENKNPTIMFAKSSKITATEIKLQDINMYKIGETGKKDLDGYFKERIEPISTFYGDFSSNKDNIENYGLIKLKKEIGKMKLEGSNYLKYEINYYRKLYLPMGTLILCVLGVVLSVTHARTGKGASFGISIFIIAIYMIAMNLITTVIEKSTLPVAFLMFVPNLILIIVTFCIYIRKIRRNQ